MGFDGVGGDGESFGFVGEGGGVGGALAGRDGGDGFFDLFAEGAEFEEAGLLARAEDVAAACGGAEVRLYLGFYALEIGFELVG